MIRISVYYPGGEGKKFDMNYYVNSLDGWQKGMGQHGKEIMADIANYTDIPPQIQISEIVG